MPGAFFVLRNAFCVLEKRIQVRFFRRVNIMDDNMSTIQTGMPDTFAACSRRVSESTEDTGAKTRPIINN